MKNPNPTGDHENTRAVALALMALVLQGCATAMLTSSQQDNPSQEITTFFNPDMTLGEPSPRTVLVNWTF